MCTGTRLHAVRGGANWVTAQRPSYALLHNMAPWVALSPPWSALAAPNGAVLTTLGNIVLTAFGDL